MKTIFLVSILVGTAGLATAQSAAPSASNQADDTVPAPTEYRIKSLDANSRVWQRDTYIKLPNGHIATQHHSYTELAANLYHKDAQGNWAESKELIESFPNGAIARQGAYQVIFANNLNTAGAIDIQEPDGKRLRSNILGLAYYDPTTGQSAVIAQVQDCQGELVGDNQVLFQNAFSGVLADVRYTYKKASFEQDIILKEQPPTPESFGLSADSEIEVMTEFISPPVETVKEHRTDGDQDIAWGVTRLGRGRAFDLGAENDLRSHAAVKRQYVTVNGRKILLERVPLPAIQASLQKLPQHAAIKSRFKTASKQLALPRPLLAQTAARPMQMAVIDPFAPLGEKVPAGRMRGSGRVHASGQAPTSQGYVLDYVQINTDQGDYVFRADSTYLLSDPNYYDSVTLEGGTVIKYAAHAEIDNWGTVTCKTGPYRPAILTAVDDDTVGEPLPGSTGTPTGYYADFAIGQETAGSTYQNLRVAYATYGLILTSSNVVTDCQFLHDASAIAAYSTPGLQVNNTLFWDVGTAFDDSYGAFSAGAANLTVHAVNDLLGSSITLAVTNSLFISATNWGATFTGVTCATNASDDGIFQVAGAASHYLPTNSPYLNAGITLGDPALLADLAAKTTSAPFIYSNTPIAGGIYPPYAQRDTLGTDLGYHYDALDYCFGRADAAASITFPAGTAVAYFDLPQPDGSPNHYSYGLSLPDASSVTYLGTATAPCAQVRYSTVQEGNGNWTDVDVFSDVAILGFVAALGSAAHTPSADATIDARFTLFANHAYQGAVGGSYSSDIIYRFTDCTVNGGRMNSWDLTSCLTNCLLLGTIAGSQTFTTASAAVSMQNCTMHEGGLDTGHYGGSTWPVKIQNCAFDNVDFTNTADDSESTDPAVTYCDYNAFVTNAVRLPMWGTHDVTNFVTFNWQTNWLGNFYLTNTSPLINAGSGTADQWGLYHFTTQTNQVKETNSIVDIGYHYVATDAYGHPLDTDGDGIPDYLEDSNGNGVFDVGDLGDWLVSLYNGLSRTNGLQVFTPLK